MGKVAFSSPPDLEWRLPMAILFNPGWHDLKDAKLHSMEYHPLKPHLTRKIPNVVRSVNAKYLYSSVCNWLLAKAAPFPSTIHMNVCLDPIGML